MERLDGETVVINFETGQYFSFLNSSADVLWLIEHGGDRGTWMPQLASAFPNLPDVDVVEEQLGAFLDQLLEVNIVEREDTEPQPFRELPHDYERAEWTAPKVKAHQDLVELLAIDPIHDTGEDGWPQSRTH